MLFFSMLINAKVIDSTNHKIGILTDVIVPLNNLYPKLSAFKVKLKNKENLILAISSVESIGPKESNYKIKSQEGFLKEHVLDRQLIDTEGIKIVRANDIAFGKIHNQMVVTSIDISASGIFRRLGLGNIPFINRQQPLLIPWTEVTLIDSPSLQLQIKNNDMFIKNLHPADIANLIEDLNIKRGADFISQFDPDIAAYIFEEMSDERIEALIKHLGVKKTGDILEKMSPDQVADILENLSKDKVKEIMAELKPEESQEIMHLIKYGEREAGGLMTTDFFIARPDWTVKKVKKELLKGKEEIKSVSYVYITDERGCYVGVLSLRELLLSKDDTKIRSIMVTNVFSIPPKASIKEIAHNLTKYNLFSIAVTNKNDKLLGVVMIDDIMRELFPEA